eukprot:scaffold67577_cov30-Tisochrysis_lutea.AAC.1
MDGWWMGSRYSYSVALQHIARSLTRVVRRAPSAPEGPGAAAPAPIPLEYFACGAKGEGRNGAVSTEGESRYLQHYSQEMARMARATDPSATVSDLSTLNCELVADG